MDSMEAAAVALFFVRTLRPAALVRMALGLLLHFFAARGLTRAYKAEAAQANLRFGLCGGLSGFSERPLLYWSPVSFNRAHRPASPRKHLG